MRPVARISIEYANLGDFQSISNRAGPKDLIVVNPLTIANYALRNRDKAGFGLNDPEYLTYDGGFLTEDDKLNIKYSNFEIKNTSTSGGNFSALDVSVLYSDININQKLVSNLKTLDTPENFLSPKTDNNPLTVKDFKDFNFYPGQIVAWQGSWDKLKIELPNWRLCAPPDSGKLINNIRIPNLLGDFVIASQPTDLKDPNGTYGEDQPFTGITGGVDAVWLNETQMPRHTHTVDLSATDIKASLTGSNTFVYDGGFAKRTAGTARNCTHKSMTCCCRFNNRVWKDCWAVGWQTFCKMKCECQTYCSSNSYQNASNVNASVYGNFTQGSYQKRRLQWDGSNGVKITSQTEQNRGGSNAHENRPEFYTLAYIIYVGVPR